ncbi:hypothetical protein MAC_07096 [Metarhizium acridum CQMa 102]|uniref:Serine-threonine protein kinase 19 n=1 Tax=Metarhizium acridum (strain CQMa 102) TaxID=655827 RepID=E9EB48_METAQ|nr:uncharacterized protein MAC_07096 [Metarhizium acridum CQMa 102]EFY86880.1 hypothetical protein MAC_07096 [Metarhizium acridum CQMa 102]
MPQSIRSILGRPRVTKPKPRSSSAQTAQSSSPRKKRPPPESQDDALFPLKFGDLGAAPILTPQEELALRDVPQAMRYIRSRMFSAVPGSGFTSTRTAEVLNYRVSIPPLVTTGHVHAVLTSSPGRIEREVVELVGKGVLRKVRVERRGGMGEALIEAGDLDEMLRRAAASGEISDAARAKFWQVLQGNAAAQTIEREGDGDHGLTASQMDELVRAGFLTSSTAAPGSTLHVRPEDRTTLTSIQHVSRFASGTVSAVGGPNAIHLAGGGGGAPALTRRGGGLAAFRIAVPGHGRFLKLADGAVDWVREALGKTKWGEGPESWLKEKFEGNGLYGTRWKEFWGVEWEWVLGQAVGLGVVEVFETGSVGKGVRALGG